MSEEILKALTQLFAILSKQDGGAGESERKFVLRYFTEELDQDTQEEYMTLYDKLTDYGNVDAAKKKRTSVRDSVRTLGIVKKFNKQLTQKQKIVVLIKIMELIASDKVITPTELEILNTVAQVFNFDEEEYEEIKSVVFYGLEDNSALPESSNILLLDKDNELSKSFDDDILIFLAIRSADMYFVKYLGDDEVQLNGFIQKPGRVYLFSPGSSVKTTFGEAFYYSDVILHFNEDARTTELSFNANDVFFKFPNGALGLRDINISEGPGKLVGIMGSSGAGKTTLLNVLSGIETPSDGSVTINGIDIHKAKQKIQGVIGYVSQDDLLIEELSVYDNLYYNAKLCFDNLSNQEIEEKVTKVLSNLGLDHISHLRVGSPLDKTISGGQRKRLNIALELIREPAVLFVDEPTSGLSSKDSENVIDLLKELSLKGKLIFVVIHQPSSDIYKMFDKMVILDVGGYMAYYGPPVEAITYLKDIYHHVDNKGRCSHCGNVNPEEIFNIVEAEVVDEYGQYTGKRKITPIQWYEKFQDNFNLTRVKEILAKPENLLNIPNKFKQSVIFTIRDVKAKISNQQYMTINLLEAPALALILAWIIKYTNTSGGDYVFRLNDNLPVFYLMVVVVALFLGLTVSSEEIIKDRKILKRESFLNLSWNSYLLSKIAILFTLSAIQSAMFVSVACLILEIRDMWFYMWMIMFTISSMSNVIGLMISGAFKSAVTVYVLIPIILIPQMVLSGLMFNYDKLNKAIANSDKVPIVADLMASRWAFEALTVQQFKKNNYEDFFFSLDKTLSESDFISAYRIKEIEKAYNATRANGADEQVVAENSALVINELKTLEIGQETSNVQKVSNANQPTDSVMQKIDLAKEYYSDLYAKTLSKKEKLVYYLENESTNQIKLSEYKDKYFNQSISDLVRNVNTTERFVIDNNRIIQKIDPVFNSNFNSNGFLNYRTHFYASEKPLFGKRWDTFWFNICVVWCMTIVFYAALYFKLLEKLINYFGNLKLGQIKTKKNDKE